MNYNTRDEVPNQYKWDLSNRFASIEDWNKLYEKTEIMIESFMKHKTNIMKNSENLYETLEDYYQIEINMIKLEAYTMLRLDEYLSDQQFQKLSNQFSILRTKCSEFTSFVDPEILQEDEQKIINFLNENEKLQKYDYTLKRLIDKKKHVLSEEEEKIISILSKGYHKFDYLNSNLLNSEIEYGKIQDENGKEIVLLSNNLRKLSKNSNREIRKQAYLKSKKARAQFEGTLGTNLLTFMDYQSQMAKIRKYNNAIEMFFEEDNIPYKVNEILNQVVHKRLSSLQKYYIDLKKHLNLSQLEEYDKNAIPFKSKQQYTIEECQSMIEEATSVLGEEYSKVIHKAFTENWIDFCSYKGKTNGAYCLGNIGDNPAILINFQGGLEDVLTVAHELGHAVNFYFKLNNYPHTYYNDSILGEVASLTNEVLFTNYFLNYSSDKDVKKAVIHRLIDTILSNLFAACFEGELENIIYKKLSNNESVSTKDLNDTILKLKNDYYGNTIKENEYSNQEWQARSHYFIPFYLYKYAVAICIACYVGREIINNNQDMKNNYLEYLHAGSDKSVVEILEILNIDITTEDVYQKAIDYYEELLEQLDNLCN